jgi:hypothetical protein
VREEWGQLHHPPDLILRQAQLKAFLKYANYDTTSWLDFLAFVCGLLSHLMSAMQM